MASFLAIKSNLASFLAKEANIPTYFFLVKKDNSTCFLAEKHANQNLALKINIVGFFLANIQNLASSLAANL